MNRCSWCNRFIFPWQEKSPGKTLHDWCFQYVNRITHDTQRQYTPRLMQARPETYQEQQQRLRREEEDRL